MVKTREISHKLEIDFKDFKPALKKLSVALFPCEIPPSATVTLGPPCQFHSGCSWANCLGDTEQIINSSPLRLTLLGGAGFCIYMSRLSRREPDPWRTTTHCYDAHIRFSAHFKIKLPFHTLLVIHSITTLCSGHIKQKKRHANRAHPSWYAYECVLNSTHTKAFTCRRTCISPPILIYLFFSPPLI